MCTYGGRAVVDTLGQLTVNAGGQCRVKVMECRVLGGPRSCISVLLSAQRPNRKVNTVNVEIFALYIFSLNSRFLNIREYIYTVKITIIIA